MFEMTDMVPCFEQFSTDNCFGAPLTEMFIGEGGIIIPREEWQRTATTMRSPHGLNFGKDNEETLTKYVDRTGTIGQVAMINVPVPVRIDQVSHAANQIYRWEHRYDQVTEEEVMSNVKMAAPKILELVLNGALTPGTGTNNVTGQNTNYSGQVWIYNIDTGLNIIVQAKGKEQRDHAIKIAVITVLRLRNMTWNKANSMPKITVSSTDARIAYIPQNPKP